MNIHIENFDNLGLGEGVFEKIDDKIPNASGVSLDIYVDNGRLEIVVDSVTVFYSIYAGGCFDIHIGDKNE